MTQPSRKRPAAKKTRASAAARVSAAPSATPTTPKASAPAAPAAAAGAPDASAFFGAGLPPFVMPGQGLDTGLGEMFKSFSGLSITPSALARVQSDYLQNVTSVWNQALERARPVLTGATQAADPAAAKPAPIGDKRFANQAWLDNPAAAYTAQMYLLSARTLMQLADSVEGDAKTRGRIRFAVQQWMDAASPSNFLAFNPEAIAKAVETRGESIASGMHNLLEDLRKGHVSQTDESVFEVGRNVATTEGSVVFENALFQLIEYKPLTARVHEKPMLFVPPCINKYYILDLQPENSVIRHTVTQGHRTFVVSWRNPDDSMVATTWDDYIEHGAIEAIRTVQAITGVDTFNMLGFCVGGTIVATALAVLAARGEQPAQSLTLLTTLLDFEDTGVLDLFIDEASVRLREMTIGAQAPSGPGLLKGGDLATTFSFLRPNDLVWNYVVGNYLKGETPPPFDLLYWNGDSTNLPGPMYCWYLRNTYLENKLKVPGATTVCGEKLDLGAIKAPVYIYGSREDHIVPWTAAYASTRVLTGPRRFVLGASGHIAGVINPPAKGKRSHWINARLPATAEAWLAGATEHPGSWWTDWSEWLASHAGRQTAAPKAPGSARFKAIEPAPGRYVKVKA